MNLFAILVLIMIRSSLQVRNFRSTSLLMRSGTGRLPSTGEILKTDASRIKSCMDFIDASPEPFHCVNTAAERLQKEGFERLEEGESWLSKPSRLGLGGKYFFTKGGSTIVAFVVGGKYVPGVGGFKVIGAHTDSPNLKLKPVTKRSGSKLVQLNVEPYGGGLWHTWFDRDLSLAGRVIVRNSSGAQGPAFTTRLLNVKRPILRIPNLCIHLRTPDEREAFKVNKEDHLAPILCDEVSKALGKPKTSATTATTAAATEEGRSEDKAETEAEEGTDRWVEAQQPELLTLIAEELQCKVEDIADFELSLYDVQPASQAGLRAEYICSGRLDNLASCFVALDALESYARNQSAVASDTGVSVIALFDHEEVGSGSAVGAGSTIMQETLERVHKHFSMLQSGGESPQSPFTDSFKASLTK